MTDEQILELVSGNEPEACEEPFPTGFNHTSLHGVLYQTPTGTRPKRIVAAAVLQDGRVWTGVRHAFIIPEIFRETGKRVFSEEQGFWTDDNRFVSRNAARAIAIGSGQLDRNGCNKTLLSEHLW